MATHNSLREDRERTLILSMADVKRLMSMEECLQTQEDAFSWHGRQKTGVSPNAWLKVAKHQSWMKLLAAYAEPVEALATKVLARYPNNPPGQNIGSLITLFDALTGFPVAIMDGAYITAIRTGAGGGLAAKHLARPDSEVVGILGTGAQARFNMLALAKTLPKLKRAKIYGRNEERRNDCARKLEEQTGVEMVPVASPEEAVRGADVVITATNSPQPVFSQSMVEPGMHINMMGIKTEVAPEAFKGMTIVADGYEVAIEDGKVRSALQEGVITEEDIDAELSEIVVGDKPGRQAESEVTAFDSSGLAVQDLAVAQFVYDKARREGGYTEVDLGVRDDTLDY